MECVDRASQHPRAVLVTIFVDICTPNTRVYAPKHYNTSLRHPTRSGQRTFRFAPPLLQRILIQLDDGSYLAEITAICEYLEEVFPNPPLVGTTPEERGGVTFEAPGGGLMARRGSGAFVA